MYNAGSESVTTSNEVLRNAELGELYDSTTCLQKGDKKLCTQMAELVRQSQINSGLHEDLTRQIRTLDEENNFLKDELSFFEHVISGSGNASSGVSIHRFNLESGEAVGEYRYTLLLVQGGARPKDFQGNLKFLVTLRQDNKKRIVALASKKASESFGINFKIYQRVEESFQVPAGTVVESLQVQVFAKGEKKARLTQTVKPSL